MDNFIEALLSGKTDRIPDEYDWFAPFIGDWDCDYYDVTYTCDHAMKRLCFTKQGMELSMVLPENHPNRVRKH